MSFSKKLHKPFGVKNYLNTCVEFFPAPLPKTLPETKENLVEPYDLFQSSREFGYEPVFIPSKENIIICDLDVDHFELIPGTEQSVTAEDFLKFQLQQINIDTLINFPNRVDFSISDNLLTELLGKALDSNCEVDSWGYPIDESKYPYWLSNVDSLFNIHRPTEENYVGEWSETLEIGKIFLDEYRTKYPDLILEPLVKAILDEDWGISRHWETKVENLSKTRGYYADWNCPLMIMYSGKMWPQYTLGWPNFYTPTYNIYDVYVRNNDEGIAGSGF